jgi:hypothetical protein
METSLLLANKQAISKLEQHTELDDDAKVSLKEAVERIFDVEDRINYLAAQMRHARNEMSSLRSSRTEQQNALMQFMLRHKVDVLHSRGRRLRCSLQGFRTTRPKKAADTESLASSFAIR